MNALVFILLLQTVLICSLLYGRVCRITSFSICKEGKGGSSSSLTAPLNQSQSKFISSLLEVLEQHSAYQNTAFQATAWPIKILTWHASKSALVIIVITVSTDTLTVCMAMCIHRS